MQFDVKDIAPPRTLKGDYLWPNELSMYQDRRGNTVMLIPDGFLMPGQSDGGIYAVINPASIYTKPVRITALKDGWFYHRAIFVQLPGGNQGILTARATKPIFGLGEGELVWLSLPNSPQLETEQLPKLQETVLAKGPDVMFEVFDLNSQDSSIEIVAAHFFQKMLSIYSIQPINQFPYIQVVDTSTVKTNGRPYGLCLASFEDCSQPPPVGKLKQPQTVAKPDQVSPTHLLITTHECSYDIPSGLEMIYSTVQGNYPRVKSNRVPGMLPEDDLKSLVTVSEDALDLNHRQLKTSAETGGGSLYAYEIPRSSLSPMSHSSQQLLPLREWKKIELFKGFKVRGWGGIFSPGKK